MTMITNALNIHLNIEQIISINTSSIIMTLKRMNVDTMSNQTIYLNDQSHISLPENLYLNASKNSTISLRVRSITYLRFIFIRNFSVFKLHFQ